MKKNATFITINPTLAKWVYEQVQNAPTNLNYELENLQHSFKDLINGNINNLILEISDNTSPLFVDEKLTFGELTIYPKNRKVLRNNIEIILTPKEFDILYFLAKNKGEVFTKCERKAPKFIYGDINSLKNNDSISLFFIVLYF